MHTDMDFPEQRKADPGAGSHIDCRQLASGAACVPSFALFVSLYPCVCLSHHSSQQPLFNLYLRRSLSPFFSIVLLFVFLNIHF